MDVITVSQLNTYLKSIIDENRVLNSIYIVGEISNFKEYRPKGHLYFTLKDEKSQLKSVMFSSYSARLKFMPEDGMRVICRGRISVYEAGGVYQLYAEDIQPDGAGALAVAFEQLKVKLSKEGLFDEDRKKALPKFPEKIGIVTSGVGAAVEDMKNIIGRRFPLAEIIIVPTIVQGKSASADIVKSIEFLDSLGDIDIIIAGRGGGSTEDLWAFNTEEVARAVFACKTPIVSAVGHETDYTICDFVADLRAETPSAAAEKITPDLNDLITRLNDIKCKIFSEFQHKIYVQLQKLDYISSDSVLCSYSEYINSKNKEVADKFDSISKLYTDSIQNKRSELVKASGMLNALNPLAVLLRGYAVVSMSGNMVKKASQLNKKDKITVRLYDANVDCTVTDIRPVKKHLAEDDDNGNVL